MPITVTCDVCSESHRVKDEAVGKKFKCKGCGKLLKVVAPAPPEDDWEDAESYDDDAGESDEDESYSRKKAPRRATSGSSRRKSSSSQSGKPKSVPLRKTKVPLGIDLVYYGFLLFILVVLGAFCVGLTLRGNVQQMTPILYGLSLVSFAATIVTTAGKLMCLTAPPQMSGKGGLYFAVAIDVLSLLITVANMMKVLPPVLAGAISLLSVAGFVCFVVFLQNLGDFLGERDIRERGSGVLQWGIGVVVLWLLLIGLGVLAVARALPVIIAGLGVMLLGIVPLIVGIIAVIRYVGLLSTCRYALSNC
ncbi:MAG: hypothetical protein ACKV2Q_02760 [Planctomycetaceae bacterium]